jgi:hypothetical protein
MKSAAPIVSLTLAITLALTAPFLEQDLLEQIQKHIENDKEAIEARVTNQQAKARERIDLYKPKDLTAYLPRATENRTFEPDMSYIVPEDIKDARGVVIYPSSLVGRFWGDTAGY